LEWVKRYLARHLRPDSRVLDVGSGPGVLAAEVARHCLRGQVVALDQSKDRSSQAGMRLARFGGYSIVGDAVDLPFDDASFDV
ncbi:class I SAM-dependent methyltransferase, partial [Escherichia coli]|uniref:class I SAM-dependent methyltransferase n=1 Tax=Escherichia coli TaxID=562 RepID=UPI003B9E5728